MRGSHVEVMVSGQGLCPPVCPDLVTSWRPQTMLSSSFTAPVAMTRVTAVRPMWSVGQVTCQESQVSSHVELRGNGRERSILV